MSDYLLLCLSHPNGGYTAPGEESSRSYTTGLASSTCRPPEGWRGEAGADPLPLTSLWFFCQTLLRYYILKQQDFPFFSNQALEHVEHLLQEPFVFAVLQFVTLHIFSLQPPRQLLHPRHERWFHRPPQGWGSGDRWGRTALPPAPSEALLYGVDPPPPDMCSGGRENNPAPLHRCVILLGCRGVCHIKSSAALTAALLGEVE